MIRTMDASFLNQVANHPKVRPHLGGEDVRDLQPKLDNAANVALHDGKGGFVFEKVDVGLYELHTMFLPAGRGADVLTAAAYAARYMFTRTDCLELITKLPVSNRAADLMVRRCGFRRLYERPAAWDDGSAVLFFGYNLEDWRQRDPVVLEAGQAFHAKLEAAKDAIASVLTSHAPDEAHDRAAGASLLMIRAGQVQKGVRAYNRWAAVAGYQPIKLLSDVPAVVDVVDAVVGIQDNRMEVLLCR